MNGNNGCNVKDLRETVFECARTFLTDVSATEIADLVVDQIETADCLELIDDGTTWERVDDSLSLRSSLKEQFGLDDSTISFELDAA